jgi:DNA-binding MarR family transcriptional regulator
VVGLWFEMQGRLQQNFADVAGEHSLTAIQAKVLMQLTPPSAITMRALADRLQYDPSNLTSVIDRLEEAGMVQRRPDPHDRRAKGLVLTEKGRRLRDAFWQRLIIEPGPLGGLSPAELELLRTLLESALAGQDQRREGPPDGRRPLV